MDKATPLQLAFLDVGHGDTTIISTIEDNIKRAIIIDCNDAIKTKNYILKNEIQVIDYIVITHLHQDHYKGVNALIDLLIKNDIKIHNVCWEKDKYLRTDEEQKSRYKAFTTKLDEYHINGVVGYVGKRFDNNRYRRLDNAAISGYKTQIIYPNSFIANHFDDKNVNNTSAVVQIEYNNFKIILPGDLEGEGWHMLNTYISDLKCDILKIPHHGGYFSGGTNTLSLGQVIDYSIPKFAIISTGQNEKYKHPSKETIEYLASKTINILCTEVTNLCDSGRINKRECVISKLEISTKDKKSCPCSGDIIFQIADEIKLISHTHELINEIRENFTNRLCTNI
jgi:competence protein ComEC